MLLHRSGGALCKYVEYFWASVTSAIGLLAESGKTQLSAFRTQSRDIGGGPSSTTCTFEPLNPNELTAARCLASPAGQHKRWVGTATVRRSMSMCGFQLEKFRCAVNSPFSSDSTVLISPATPA